MQERRTFASEDLEWRSSAGPGSLGVIAGYAPVFGRLSRDLGGFVEEVQPKAVNRTLSQGGRIMGRYNHSALLGTTSNRTVRLAADEVGVHYEIDVPDTTAGRDAAVLIERGDVIGSSFAFVAHSAEWGKTERGYPLRSLEEIALVDTGPVDDPAYLDSPATMQGARSMAALAELVTETRSLDDLAAAAQERRLADLLDGVPVVDLADVGVDDGGEETRDQTARPTATGSQRALHMATMLAEAEGLT